MKLFTRLPILLLSIICLKGVISGIVAQTADTNNSQEATTPGAHAAAKTVLDQEQDQTNNPYLEYNKNSIHPIPEPDILFRKRIWREIYLKEKKNKPFFARGKEITKFIIDGVKQGILVPYKDEKLDEKITKEQFLENLALPQQEALSAHEKALGFTEDSGWDNKKVSTTDNKTKSKEKEVEEFLANEITTLEVMEDLIFDKVKSIFLYDVQTIKLIIPAEKFPTGLRKTVATFRYKDLAAYFDSKPKEALWINVKNSAGNIKLTEAIERRLFDSRIVKIENPDDLTVDDIYNKTPKQSLYASQALEEELIELDQFLWEN
jgi:gliding motility associated protien GldN